MDRFRQAASGAKRQLKTVRKKIPDNTRSGIIVFIDTHLPMLDDVALTEPKLNTEMATVLRSGPCSYSRMRWSKCSVPWKPPICAPEKMT
ncbi:hypothetical protein [Candidatus Vondammii sp. HM_W22]|uniref:hypothetical protein n=1 Tax=Candidatus Vondammii sp. HM_W22 TaxID=2687299 RepID=UPI001F13B0EF|nr:hypothetical protein [Candidatus Vondammii sp. HM_W22]